MARLSRLLLHLAVAAARAHDTAGSPEAESHRAWTSSLTAEFERLRLLLPTLDYDSADTLLKESVAKLGPRPAKLLFPQEKIEHMVVRHHPASNTCRPRNAVRRRVSRSREQQNDRESLSPCELCPASTQVLFVENRAFDHIWGCIIGDRPGVDGIPSNSSKCGTATLVCKGKYADTHFNASQLPVKAAIVSQPTVFQR